jgi:hypothetical protein
VRLRGWVGITRGDEVRRGEVSGDMDGQGVQRVVLGEGGVGGSLLKEAGAERRVKRGQRRLRRKAGAQMGHNSARIAGASI